MSRKGDKHYSKEQEQLLIDNFTTMGYKELGELVNRSAVTVYHKCRRLGLVVVDPELSRLKTGNLNGNWKGGISYLKSGYVRDNLKSKNVHTLTMEKSLGRELTSKEMIHHIDGRKSNNNIDNLILCENAREHRLLHASLEQVAFKLVQQNIIKFNHEQRKYYIG